VDSGLYERAAMIFLDAAELPHGQRAAFVEEACGGEVALRDAVERLLAHDDVPLSLLGAAPGRGAAFLAQQIRPDGHIAAAPSDPGAMVTGAGRPGRRTVHPWAVSLAVLAIAVGIAAVLPRPDRPPAATPTAVPDPEVAAAAMPSPAAVAGAPGDLADPIASQRQLVEQRRTALGPDHPETMDALEALARLLEEDGRTDEALPLFERAWRGRARSMGPDHISTLSSQQAAAEAHAAAGRLDETESILRDLLERRRRTGGATHPATIVTLGRLGEVCADLGRLDDAEPLLAEAVLAAHQGLPRDSAFLAVLLGRHAACLIALGRFDRAESAALEAERILVGAFGSAHPRTTEARSLLADLYELWGRPDEAATWRTRAKDDRPPGLP